MTRHLPHVGLLLLATIIVLALARLGFWQLDRAAQKQTEQQHYQQRGAASPLDAIHLLLPGEQLDSLRFRRTQVSGRYDPKRQMLLDNRTEGGVAGYHVYTPLVLDPGQPLLLVNRGWVAAGPRRDRLPALDVGGEQRVVNGTVELPRSDLFLLGDPGYGQAVWPRVVQKIDPVLLAEALGKAVAPVVVLLDPDDADGFSRRWTPYLGISPDRHRGYAAQWFALAATLLVIAVSLSWRRRGARAGR